jgi:DoxX-like family
MEIAYAIVAVVASVMLAMSARLKLVRDPRAVDLIGDVVGVPLRYFPVLATLEIAGAVGLLVGIAFEPLGIAAGVGLVAYFVVAVLSHVRARDLVRDHIFPAILMLVVSIAALGLRLAA